MDRNRSCNRRGRRISTEGVEKRGCRWLMQLKMCTLSINTLRN